ncbi:MAG: hypothetical protein Q9217_004930 [Psora testacea]
MINLSLTMAPLITGNLHVMSNPLLGSSTPKIIDNAQQPSFDLSRICIKVVSTWEGLQACRKLANMGIKTLATTLFTMEQAILAAEAGCAYIAPFLHELKAFFDDTYKDNEPCFDLCLKAQQYYERHSYPTRMKVAGLLTVDHAMRLAGSSSMTIAPALLRELSGTNEAEAEVASRSLFKKGAKAQEQVTERVSFIDDEIKYREAFVKSDSGKGEGKTAQVRKNHLQMNNFASANVSTRRLVSSASIRAKQRH